MHEGSRKAIIAAFFANLGIAIAKFVGFAITASAVAAGRGDPLAGRHRQPGAAAARRQPRPPPGRRPSTRSATGGSATSGPSSSSIVLFSMGGLFALYEGIEKLRHPHETENLSVAVVILLFAIVLESFSLRTAVQERDTSAGHGMRGGTFIRPPSRPSCPSCCWRTLAPRSACSSRSPAWSWPRSPATPAGTPSAASPSASLLVVIAIVLAIEMKGLLIGESATPEMPSGHRATP